MTIKVKSLLMVIFNNFGDALRYALDKKGITQTTLAEKIGLKRPQISNWVNNYAVPRSGNVNKICSHIDDNLSIRNNNDGKWFVSFAKKNDINDITLLSFSPESNKKRAIQAIEMLKSYYEEMPTYTKDAQLLLNKEIEGISDIEEIERYEENMQPIFKGIRQAYDLVSLEVNQILSLRIALLKKIETKMNKWKADSEEQ